jgi:peptidoglycan lytic transglycosylase
MVRKLSAHRKPAVKQKKTRLAASRQKTRGMSDARLASDKRPSRSRIAILGLASFYSEDRETASGESFNKRALTAAHPHLPFGTRLRVTNVRNGRSVIVRVNDRGPFVGGRIIDVTLAAAEALGMINAGVAKVALDIVR